MPPIISERNLTELTLGALFLCTLAYGSIKLLQVGRRPFGLPPGPRTLPILGNLHLMPTVKPYMKFAAWGKVYGPIYSLMVGPNPLIVIQSHKIAKELLDKRGSNYSSRPDLYVLSDLASRGMRQVMMVSVTYSIRSCLFSHTHRRNIRKHGVKYTVSITRS
jgi:hypothetical protein